MNKQQHNKEEEEEGEKEKIYMYRIKNPLNTPNTDRVHRLSVTE